MQIKIILFLTIVLALNPKESFSSPIDSLIVKLVMKNTIINKDEDLVIGLSIEAKYKSIVVPKYLSYGFLLGDSVGTGYISIQIQKKLKGEYKDVQLGGTMDNLPIDKLDTLAVKDTRKESCYMGGMFRSDKGEYRVRVLCFASKIDNSLTDVYSNWVYFRCLKNVSRYTKK